MKLNFYSGTHTGLVRTENQDTMITDGENRIFIVADGMGGHKGGKNASALGVKIIHETLKKTIHENPSASMNHIKEAYEKANRMIHTKGLQNIQLRGMGTTMCLLIITADGTGYIGNVGDSRLYLLEDQILWQLTEDHTFITHQIKANLITGQQREIIATAEDYMLTKSVGFAKEVEPDIFKKTVQPNEVYLICSDGLTGTVSNKEIQNILNTYNGQQRVNQCIKKALERGGGDNISVIIIEIS